MSDISADTELLARVVGQVVIDANFNPSEFASCEQTMIAIYGKHRATVVAVVSELSDDEVRALARLSDRDYDSVVVNASMAIYHTLAAMVIESKQRRKSLH